MWEVVMLGAAALAAGLGDGRAVVRVVRRNRGNRRVAKPGREEGVCMVVLADVCGRQYRLWICGSGRSFVEPWQLNGSVAKSPE